MMELPILVLSCTEDQQYAREFEIHLAPRRRALANQGHTLPGFLLLDQQEETPELLDAVREMRVVVALLSPKLLYWLSERTMLTALLGDMRTKENKTLIPVHLLACRWREEENPFSKLRGSPRDGRPIFKVGNKDERLSQVMADLREFYTTEFLL